MPTCIRGVSLKVPVNKGKDTTNEGNKGIDSQSGIIQSASPQLCQTFGRGPECQSSAMSNFCKIPGGEFLDQESLCKFRY